MKHVTLPDFLTVKEVHQIAKLSESLDPMSTAFLDAVEKKFIQPNMERINQSLSQENDSRYLAYAIAFALSQTTMFRPLTSEEEEAFRQYARDNDPPDMAQWEVYHPICREEWTRRGIKP